MPYECLKTCDGRKKGLIADWEKWIKCADRLYGHFLDEIGDPPFYFHEVASVSFLASAAAIAGYVPIQEYDVIKIDRSDRRKTKAGRADLWFSSFDRCYSFEFKRAYFSATMKNLKESLRSAVADIDCVHAEEYHYAAAGLLAHVSDDGRDEILRNFARQDEVSCAYRIGPEGENGAFIFFSVKD